MSQRSSTMPWSRAAILTLGALLSLGAIKPAEAHPHVFVVAKELILFAPNGKISGVRAAWTFDDMYSSFLVQGIGSPGDILTEAQLAPLAKTNVESLAEFGYFTVAKAHGKALEFSEPVDYKLDEGSDKLITLTFTLPLKQTVSASPAFTLSVYDPTYFVSFELADKDPVGLVSAPAGCSASVSKPQSLDAADNQKLSEAFFSNLSPGTDFGIKLASRAIVACP